MPSNLAKYSGLLEPHQENILSKFLESHNVSKAKVIGLLLEDWEKNNYPKFEDSDRPVKLLELSAIVNQLIEDKLNNLNIPNLVKNQVSKVHSEVSNEVSNDNQLSLFSSEGKVSNNVANLTKNAKGSNKGSNKVNNLTANVSNKTANQDDNLEYETRIDVKAEVVTEKLENINITESEGINEDKNETLPDEMSLESIENDEGIITPENGKDSLKSDSKRVKSKMKSQSNRKEEKKKSYSQKTELKPLPQDFLDLPINKVTATKLAEVLGYKQASSLTRIANQDSLPQFEGFWSYLRVTKNDKDKFVWEKIN